ncbi:MAG: NusA N-terminal domain-containing protein [Spirochaetota bacterium]
MTKRKTGTSADTFYNEIETIAKDKNISNEAVLECFKKSLIVAYRNYLYKSEGSSKENKKKDKTSEVELEIAKSDKNRLEIFIKKEVVKKPELLLKEISLKEAKQYDENVELGQSILVPVDYSNFPSTVVRTAIETFIQEIQNYVGNKLYEEYKKLEGTIIVGKVHRAVKGALYVNLDDNKIEAILPQEEQSPIENIKPNETRKFLIKKVEANSSKAVDNEDAKSYSKNKKASPIIILSRADPKFIYRLIEDQVDEVARGDIEIKKIVREPGFKTKVAVWTKNSSKDPVGTILGKNSSKISAIRSEISNEVIEIIEYSTDEEQFIKNALNVSKFGQGKIIKIQESEGKKRCIFVVEKKDDKDKIVGKNGINVKLASRLTGWKIVVETREEFINSEIYKMISKEAELMLSKSIYETEQEENEMEEIGEEDSISVLVDHLGRELIQKLQDAGIDVISSLIDWYENDRLRTISSLTTDELFKIRHFIEQNVEIEEESDEEYEEEESFTVCPNCGKSIDPDATECPYCGIKFADEE